MAQAMGVNGRMRMFNSKGRGEETGVKLRTKETDNPVDTLLYVKFLGRESEVR